jgi:hypothetical protein
MIYFKAFIASMMLSGMSLGCLFTAATDSEESVVSGAAEKVSIATVRYAGGESVITEQDSAISVVAPKQWYSEPLTKSELWQKGLQHGFQMHEPWKYMGTKNGEHYLMLYPLSGFKQIYRVSEEEYQIDAPFELMSSSSKWRDIMVFTHDGVRYPVQIKPHLLMLPEGKIQLDANQVDGWVGGMEQELMQQVLILQAE